MGSGKDRFYSSSVFLLRVMGKAAMVAYCRLANLLSNKWNSSYSLTMGWHRYSLSFSLLCSSLMCLRGSRSSSGSPSLPTAVDLVVSEGHLAAVDLNF